MSFRLFLYYCGVCGGWAALMAWVVAKILTPENPLLSAMFQAMTLGVVVALALSVVDGWWNSSGRPGWGLGRRVLVSVGIGCVGGLVGGLIGQMLFSIADLSAFIVFGWVLTGMLIGTSVGGYDVLLGLIRAENLRGSLRKVIHGTIGGAAGGFVGGVLFLLLRGTLSRITGRPADELLSSSALGFMILGAAIGLLIGLAQVILKEAWLRVESGFRPGRELILTRPETIIGRAEGCDLGLYGGQGVEKKHALILQHGAEYILADAQTPGGTFLNDRRITTPTPLRAGDRIRVGNCVLQFHERKKSGGAGSPR